MKALIIVESMFGNTRVVADRVAEQLRSRLAVEVYDVGAAPRETPDDVQLLIVGAPTHAFGLSRTRTRADAANKGAAPVTLQGLRDWLDEAPRFAHATWATAFDTRISKPRLPGSAAHAAGRKLHRLGARILTPPMSFYVDDVDGPLRAGEHDRADAWARDILTALSRHGLLSGQGERGA